VRAICVSLNKCSGNETSSNLPLQGDRVSTCEDGEQEGVLRDEVGRDDMTPGCVVLEAGEAGRGQVEQTTFLTGNRIIL